VSLSVKCFNSLSFWLFAFEGPDNSTTQRLSRAPELIVRTVPRTCCVVQGLFGRVLALWGKTQPDKADRFGTPEDADAFSLRAPRF